MRRALTVTSSSTLSQVKVQGEPDAKGSDNREPERGWCSPVKKKKKSMRVRWWVSFSISYHDSCSRWPLGKLAVRPSVSSLPIRPGTVKRSRGGLCRFVNLKHQGSAKYLYHCQHAWHLSILCKWQIIMLAERKAKHTNSKAVVQKELIHHEKSTLHISFLCRTLYKCCHGDDCSAVCVLSFLCIM